jgi:hypothetical protein
LLKDNTNTSPRGKTKNALCSMQGRNIFRGTTQLENYFFYLRDKKDRNNFPLYFDCSNVFHQLG